jgi:hypothetical protein
LEALTTIGNDLSITVRTWFSHQQKDVFHRLTPLRSQYNQELRSLEGIDSLARVDFHVFIEVPPTASPLTVLEVDNPHLSSSVVYPEQREAREH